MRKRFFIATKLTKINTSVVCAVKKAFLSQRRHQFRRRNRPRSIVHHSRELLTASTWTYINPNLSTNPPRTHPATEQAPRPPEQEALSTVMDQGRRAMARLQHRGRRLSRLVIDRVLRIKTTASGWWVKVSWLISRERKPRCLRHLSQTQWRRIGAPVEKMVGCTIWLATILTVWAASLSEPPSKSIHPKLTRHQSTRTASQQTESLIKLKPHNSVLQVCMPTRSKLPSIRTSLRIMAVGAKRECETSSIMPTQSIKKINPTMLNLHLTRAWPRLLSALTKRAPQTATPTPPRHPMPTTCINQLRLLPVAVHTQITTIPHCSRPNRQC